VHCTRLGTSRLDADVDAVDVSTSGVRIVAPRGVASGDVLELVLDAPEPIRTTGIVVACRDTSGLRHRSEAHIAFTNVTASVQAQLDGLVAQIAPDFAGR
jgi:hypothetical protein